MATDPQHPSFRLLTSKGKLLKTLFSGAWPYVALFLTLVVVSFSFGQLGGIDDTFSALLLDFPYLALLFSILLYSLRPGIGRALLAIFPFAVLYISIDLYYIYLHSILKLDDFLLIPEGFNICPTWVRVSIVMGVGGWAAAFLFFLKRRPRQLILPLLLILCAALPPLAAFKSPKFFLNAAETLGLSVIPWSDRYTSELMGRTTALLLFAAAKNKALDELALLPKIDDPDRDPALLASTLHDKRNIHILVLESFLDPKLFSKLKFKTPPEPPQFDAVRKKMHVALSPVFGGGTAQAEFELLCGVPAYRLYHSAEFNAFDGSATRCLPNLLAGAGYRTIATQSYIPEFFNSEKAYRSLGFEETHFPSVYAGNRPTYLKYDNPDEYMFDGDLLAQNLSYVEKLLADGHPFLNYVLGIYGHLPHETDTKRFPPKVDIEGVEKNSQAYLAMQQFYYRAEAVADYLQKLRKMDPNSLILVTSDHLPPLDRGPETYKHLGYNLVSPEGEYKQNIYMFYGPQSKKTAWPHHYYEYMDFLLDTLTRGSICQHVVCKNRVAWLPEKLTVSYNNIMMQASGISKKSGGLVAETSPQSAVNDQESPQAKQ